MALKQGNMQMIINMIWDESDNPCGELSYFVENERRIRSFDGLGELIIEMDTICDEQGYPQKDTELRSLITRSNAKTLPQKETETSIRIGKLQKLSLPVCIMMRQNSSMQGFLQYTGEEICFRSSLELMRMLHEYIKTKSIKNKERVV